VVVLTFPAIAWLGAACERPDTPTEATLPPAAFQISSSDDRWVNRVDPNGPPYSPTGGTSCNDPGYQTIVAAVAASMSGDIIHVCASAISYTENVLVNVTNLTLLGAQAGMPVAGRVSGGPLESTVTGANPFGGNPVIAINAANVTVDGFTLKNPITTGAAIGIDVKTAGTGAVIANNIIDGVTTADPSANGSAQAVYLENGPDDVRILDNDLRNVQSGRSAKGVHIGDAGSTNPSQNILVQGNSIQSITSGTRGAYGVSINNGNGTTVNSGLVIRDNSITNLVGLSLLAPSFNGWVHAIGLEANTPGVLVTGNTISNLVSPPVMGFVTAVGVWFEVTDPTYYTGHVNQNNLDVTIADYGIQVDPNITDTRVVDGTCNWWGDPSGPGPVGPGTGAMVSAKVDYAPWLTAPAPSGPCAGGLPSGGQVTGGGQIDVMVGTTSGVGSFGFSANATRGSGHLDYMNHVDRTHLNCTVTMVVILPPGNKARLDGTCSSNNYTGNFTADVADNADPGKNGDTFKITYNTTTMDGSTTMPIRSGNIKIH
jgi:hypothetical protein